MLELLGMDAREVNGKQIINEKSSIRANPVCGLKTISQEKSKGTYNYTILFIR